MNPVTRNFSQRAIISRIFVMSTGAGDASATQDFRLRRSARVTRRRSEGPSRRSSRRRASLWSTGHSALQASQHHVNRSSVLRIAVCSFTSPVAWQAGHCSGRRSARRWWDTALRCTTLDAPDKSIVTTVERRRASARRWHAGEHSNLSHARLPPRTTMKKSRIAVIVTIALTVLGATVHAATPHAAASCWLCSLCPF